MANKTLIEAQEKLSLLIGKFNKKTQAQNKCKRSLEDLERELADLSAEIEKLRNYITKITANNG